MTWRRSGLGRLAAVAVWGAVLAAVCGPAVAAGAGGHNTPGVESVGGALTVEISGLRNAKGLLRIAIFDDPREFPKGSAMKRIDIPAVGTTMTVPAGAFPAGRYAFAFFHDEDGDNDFDTTMLGIPREGYGFSRDARAFLTAPAFDAAAFEIGDGGAVQAARMRYW